MHFFLGISVGCFIGAVVGTFLAHYFQSRPLDPEIVRKKLESILKEFEGRPLTFGDLYLNGELSPKDIATLRSMIKEFQAQGRMEVMQMGAFLIHRSPLKTVLR